MPLSILAFSGVEVVSLSLSGAAILVSVVLWILSGKRQRESEARTAEQTERALRIAQDARAAASQIAEETARQATEVSQLRALKEMQVTRELEARQVRVELTVRSGGSPLDTGIGPNAIFVKIQNKSAFPIELQAVWFRHDKGNYYQWCTPRGLQDPLNIERQKSREPEQLPGQVNAYGAVEVDLSGGRVKGSFSACLNPVPYETESFRSVNAIGVRVNGQDFILEDEASLKIVRKAIESGRMAKARHVPTPAPVVRKIGNLLGQQGEHR